MSTEGELREKASEIASGFQNQATHLKREYLKAQKHALEAKAKLDFANLAFERLTNFKPLVGADFQCPWCWMESASKLTLRAVSSPDGTQILRCRNGHEFTF